MFAIYVVLIAQAAAAAWLIGRWACRAGPRLGFVDRPGGRHAHKRPTPTLGGLTVAGAVFVCLFVDTALGWLLRDALVARLGPVGPYLANIASVAPRLGALACGALAMLTLGMLDDRRPLGPRFKLAAMVLVALVPVGAGVRIQGFLPWAWVGGLATVVWIVFLVNSFNFLDNMDGLSGGVAAIVSLAFLLLSLAAGEWFVAALHALLAGALIGFLRYNLARPSARLFLGDGGSLFTGYFVAVLSILATYYQRGVPTVLPVLTPVIVLGVPIFDTLSVMWIRWREGRPLMQGDRSHFSHRLVALGMSPRRAVTFIYIVTAAVALGAVPLRSAPLGVGLAVLCQTALLFWIVYRLERAGGQNGRY